MALRDRPGFVTRNQDTLAAFNLEQLSVLVESLQFNATVKPDENGEFIGTLEEIEDVVVSGATVVDALNAIASNLLEYAEECLTDSFRLYFHATDPSQTLSVCSEGRHAKLVR